MIPLELLRENKKGIIESLNKRGVDYGHIQAYDADNNDKTLNPTRLCYVCNAC